MTRYKNTSRILIASLSLTTALFVYSHVNAAGMPAQEIPYYPLNPLTADEINQVRHILKISGHVTQNTRFQEMTLKEPAKDQVWNWKPGIKLPRLALVVALQGKRVFESIVDLDKNQLVSWQEVQDVQGMILRDDWDTVQKAVTASEEYKKALKKRGITDISKVIATPLSVGYFGPKDKSADPKKRLLKSVAYVDTGDGNFWAHPIENLVAVVDLEQKKVIQIQDGGVIPVPMTNDAYAMGDKTSQREPATPLEIVQTKGPSFHVNGNKVEWQHFSFHFRIDPRVGPIISTVTYNDHGHKRKIMYQGNLGGMMVPYGDPSVGWYFKTYMDAGEYGLGNLGRPLIVGSDVPANAKLFDAILVDYQGKPYVSHQVLGLFERDGGPEWTHNDFLTGTTESRDRRELVLRFITTIGNYDYIFDWVFMQNGAIRIDAGASGIEAVKAVASKTIHDSNAHNDTRHGTLVRHHLVGIYHQHIYNFRLDLDIDGMKNNVAELAARAEVPTNNTYRNSAIVVDKKIYQHELEAAQKWTDPSKILLVMNTEKENKQGYPTGFQIIPYAGGTQAFAENLLFTTDSYLAKRVAFSGKHFWVTPYDANENYPEGKYINQSTKETGLGLWTQQNRSIVNKDIVVWVTTGVTHIPRAEEWPMLPTEWVSVMLKPFNFFDRTPTLDLLKPAQRVAKN